MRVPDRPCDIPGIPAKYSRWRPRQKETVEWLLENVELGSKYNVIRLPVGSGKSLTAIAVANLCGMPTDYITSTRQLQQQVANDFPEAAVIWGRRNYQCVRFLRQAQASFSGAGFDTEELTAEDCTDREHNPCSESDQCPYKLAKNQAARAKMVVVNYAFYLAAANCSGDFSPKTLAILDEADRCDAELSSYAKVELTDKMLKRCGLEPPEDRRSLQSWLTWAGGAQMGIRAELRRMEETLDGILESHRRPPRGLLQELTNFGRLKERLSLFTEYGSESSWVAELEQERWDFQPTWSNRLGYRLWGHPEHLVAMSGTITPEDWCRELGVKVKPGFHSIPSYFPKENRPILYAPACDFGERARNEQTLPAMMAMIDSLLEEHPRERGLIHTNSYQLAEHIVQHTRHPERLVTHRGVAGRARALAELGLEPGRVLVSPSFTRGTSFDGDLARFQIIVRLPFLSPRDKQVAGRLRSGQTGWRWYNLQAVYSLEQVAGRPVRSETDWARTYILDMRWPKFFQKMKADFSESFKESVDLKPVKFPVEVKA